MIRTATLPQHASEGYAALRAQASELAGTPNDIARRVQVHHQIYQDSRGNHTFPMVALHGALWAAGFFETTGRLGQTLRARYFYSPRERTFRMSLLARFAEGFKIVNRQVFIDTFTNYFYTKHYGTHAAAGEVMHPDLFAALNTVHAAARVGTSLSPQQKRNVFTQALWHEQEVTVAPGVASEIARFDCPILRFLCLRPLVRFAYFPRTTYLLFRNFADKDERIAKAMTSYDLAERAGWTRVEACMATARIASGGR